VAVDLTPPVQLVADNEILFLELPGGLFSATNSLERLALDGGFSLRSCPSATLK
jgi:hypothetical protein